MSAAKREENREVIPRWRDVSATARHRELSSTSPKDKVVPEADPAVVGELRRRGLEFRQSPTLSFAADLVSGSVVLGPIPETIDAAEVVLRDERSSEMVRATARSIVERAEDQTGAKTAGPLDDETERRQAIRQLRRGLRANPRNAIRWAELARRYTNQGQVRKALNAMHLAVAMAPTDRYVLRSAARLYIHDADLDQALRLLTRDRSALLADPWLLASELATSAVAGRTSRHVKRAREMLDASRHSPFALSELASALATLELHAGDRRRARRLFNTALVDPNENSVAQAEWASKHVDGLSLDDRVERSPEARAVDSSETDDVESTLGATWEWLLDQPFSSSPAIFGSYHASKFRRFEDGARLAEHGLQANPRDPLLLNNRAFCLASLDRWQEAETVLGHVDHSASRLDLATITATRGLIRYRAGDIERGRQLYEEAISRMDSPVFKMRAQLMQTSEEIRAGGATVAAGLTLIDALRGVSDNDVKYWIAFIPTDS